MPKSKPRSQALTPRRPFTVGPEAFSGQQGRTVYWAATGAAEALAVPVLAICAFTNQRNLSFLAALAILAAPAAAFTARRACRSEATKRAISFDEVFDVHLAIGAGIPAALVFAGLFAVLSGGIPSFGGGILVVCFAIVVLVGLSLVGLIISMPFSIIAGLAAAQAAKRPKGRHSQSPNPTSA